MELMSAATRHSFIFGNTKTRAMLTMKFKKGRACRKAGVTKVSKKGLFTYAPIKTTVQKTIVGIVSIAKATCLMVTPGPSE